MNLKQFFRKDGATDQIAMLAITLGLVWWVLNAIFGGDLCKKAQVRLQEAEVNEQEKLEESREDGYRPADGATRPEIIAIRTRMYAQEDVAKAC